MQTLRRWYKSSGENLVSASHPPERKKIKVEEAWGQRSTLAVPKELEPGSHPFLKVPFIPGYECARKKKANHFSFEGSLTLKDQKSYL